MSLWKHMVSIRVPNKTSKWSRYSFYKYNCTSVIKLLCNRIKRVPRTFLKPMGWPNQLIRHYRWFWEKWLMRTKPTGIKYYIVICGHIVLHTRRDQINPILNDIWIRSSNSSRIANFDTTGTNHRATGWRVAETSSEGTITIAKRESAPSHVYLGTEVESNKGIRRPILTTEGNNVQSWEANLSIPNEDGINVG